MTHAKLDLPVEKLTCKLGVLPSSFPCYAYEFPSLQRCTSAMESLRSKCRRATTPSRLTTRERHGKSLCVYGKLYLAGCGDAREKARKLPILADLSVHKQTCVSERETDESSVAREMNDCGLDADGNPTMLTRRSCPVRASALLHRASWPGSSRSRLECWAATSKFQADVTAKKTDMFCFFESHVECEIDCFAQLGVFNNFIDPCPEVSEKQLLEPLTTDTDKSYAFNNFGSLSNTSALDFPDLVQECRSRTCRRWDVFSLCEQEEDVTV